MYLAYDLNEHTMIDYYVSLSININIYHIVKRVSSTVAIVASCAAPRSCGAISADFRCALRAL